MDIVKTLAKKLRRADDAEEEEPMDLLVIEEAEEEKDDDSEFQEKIMERLTTIDDELPRLKMGVNSVRKDIDEIRNELGRLDENLRDIMMLYEVVSTQINPFIGESKVTATSMEKLERMNEEVKEVKTTLEDILVDIRILALKDFNVHSIIGEVMQEG